MAHDNDDASLLSSRKADHIALCAEEDVEARRAKTLLDEVQFEHDSLPELDVATIDTRTVLAGHTLAWPLMISGMTGGVARARDINRGLAGIASDFGIAFGVGSQRAMLRDRALAATYQVRDVAPNAFIAGNIGAVQAAESSQAELEDLVATIDANALCIHLNPAQEIVQEHGDRDFRGCIDAIARLSSDLSLPIIAKETGAGMSRTTLDRLKAAGVRTVDVSGAGGTTWVGVEALRGGPVAREVGAVLWDWGVPTAVSVAWGAERGLGVIASGGIRSGLDAARAIALGASVASAALPFLRAWTTGGDEAAHRQVQVFAETIRAVMLLTGSPDLAALRRARRVHGPTLDRWLRS
jgi:isopentenyl-diphosphate delta-isomerase